jgi:hypothetical protein
MNAGRGARAGFYGTPLTQGALCTLMEYNYMLTERLGDPIQGYFNNSLISRLLLSRNEWEEIEPSKELSCTVFLNLCCEDPPLPLLFKGSWLSHNPILTHRTALCYPYIPFTQTLTSFLLRFGVAISLHDHLKLVVMMYSYSSFPL